MTLQDTNIIGSTEKVDFPEFNLEGIPAKVDTGADSSAIWASAINEHEGELTFTLFDKSSRFYTGQPITTKDYQLTQVKNSFGHAEFRYKVRLKVRLSGRLIIARFTLADRSANRFPILIGRRTLHGKFFVDVTRKHRNEDMHILVLTKRAITSNQRFFAGIEQKVNKRLHFTLAHYSDLQYEIGNHQTSISLRNNGDDIAVFDMVFFKDVDHEQHMALTAARYLQKRGVAYIDEYLGVNYSQSKLFQAIMLDNADVPVPQSVFVAPEVAAHSFDLFATKLGLPFVLKDVFANKGKDNFLITNDRDFAEAFAQAPAAHFIAQRYIPNDGDYRMLVMGGRSSLTIHRTADNGYLNNTAKGASAVLEDKDVPLVIHEQSVRAAQILRYAVAGVDMIKDQATGEWYCLEVNDSPQISSGAFVAEKQTEFADFVTKYVKKNG